MHEFIDIKDLQEDVIEEIKQSRKLSRCPCCGDDLKKIACLDEKEPAATGKKVCLCCDVVWKLHPTDKTPCVGLQEESQRGRCFLLEGFAHCYCRQEVFKDFV